jgi:hypothetical protein
MSNADTGIDITLEEWEMPDFPGEYFIVGAEVIQKLQYLYKCISTSF